MELHRNLAKRAQKNYKNCLKKCDQNWMKIRQNVAKIIKLVSKKWLNFHNFLRFCK